MLGVAYIYLVHSSFSHPPPLRQPPTTPLHSTLPPGPSTHPHNLLYIHIAIVGLLLRYM